MVRSVREAMNSARSPTASGRFARRATIILLVGMAVIGIAAANLYRLSANVRSPGMLLWQPGTGAAGRAASPG
jgi:hypothetical protein